MIAIPSTLYYCDHSFTLYFATFRKSCTVKSWLSRLVGTLINSPDNRESRWSKIWILMIHFNPSLVLMLSVDFRFLYLSFRMSEICCLLMLYSWAKFVPFSPLSKHEIIICLSLINRMAHFCFVDMFLIWVYDRSLVCLHDPSGRN